jgi:hypothetical protein
LKVAIAFLANAAVSAAGVPQAQVGYYESRQPEVAAGLELSADGHFRYGLDYGALSEFAEGKWTSDGRTVWLTSVPMPRAPSFVIVRDDPAPQGEYTVTLENPGFDWGGPLEFMATIEGQPAPVRITPDEDGSVTGLTGRVVAIRPIVPVYGDLGEPLALKGLGGHKLIVRFLGNDLGKARLSAQPVVVEDGGLRLDRYAASFRLIKVAPER